MIRRWPRRRRPTRRRRNWCRRRDPACCPCSRCSAPRTSRTSTRTSTPTLRSISATFHGRLHGVGEPAAVPDAELDLVRPGEATGRSERIRAGVGAAGSDRASVAGVLRRPAGAVHNQRITQSQKAAVSENLAQAQRNFEVGVATITDTNDAQAKFDQIAAQEISVQNDLENKQAVLRSIIGRAPRELKPPGMERSYRPEMPAPKALQPWIDRRCARTAGSHRAGELRHRDARGRSPAGGPLSNSRSGRELQPDLRGRWRRRPTSPPISRTTPGWA